MKFTLQITIGEDLTIGMVRDALEYDDNWPNPDRTENLNVVDVNGQYVGLWIATDDSIEAVRKRILAEDGPYA